jgi:hypothetical protein
LAGAVALALMCATGCAADIPEGCVGGHETSSSDGPIDPSPFGEGDAATAITDAILANWTAVAVPTGTYTSADTDGDRIVAVSSSGSIYSTDDGETWTSGGAVTGGIVAWSEALGKFCAIPLNSSVRTASLSTDAETWTAYTSALPSLITWRALRDIGSHLVAVGTYNGTWYASRSTDGQTWSAAITIGTTSPQQYASAENHLVWTGTNLVLSDVETNAGWYVYTSPTGETWTKRTVLTGTTGSPAADYPGVLAASGRTVLMMSRSTVATPTIKMFRSGDDGVTWAEIDHDLPTTMTGTFLPMFVAPSYFVGFYGSLGIYSSRDGETWTLRLRPAGFVGQSYSGVWTGRRAIVVGAATNSPYLGVIRSLQR